MSVQAQQASPLSVARRWPNCYARPAAGARLFLRFEPFILHAECRDMDVAARMLAAARVAGYRESGATVGSSGGRVMVRGVV